MSRHALKRRIVIASSFLLFGLSGCQTHYESGMDAIAQQRWDDAEREAREGLASDPNDPRYNYVMAKALAEQARQVQEKKSAQGTVESQEARKKYKEAKQFAKVALDSGELNAQAGRLLGKIEWELSNQISTVKAWKIARAADPAAVSDRDYMLALYSALETSMMLDDFESTLSLRQELREWKSSRPDQFTTLGQELELVSALDDATQDRALVRDLENMAQTQEANNETEKALATYAKLSTLSTKKDGEYEFAKGRLLLKEGREPEARAAFDAYISAGESNQRTRQDRMLQVARYSERLEMRGMAIGYYEQMVGKGSSARKNDKLFVLVRLISLYLAVDEKDDAKKHIESYLELRRGLSAYMTVADIARRYGATNLSIELLERASKKEGADLRVTETLAIYYAQQSRRRDVERVWLRYIDQTKRGASEALRRALNWSKNQRRDYDLAQFFGERLVQESGKANDWRSLAEVYAIQANTEALKGAVKQFIKLSSKSVETYTRAADLYEQAKMFEEAEKLYQKAQKLDPKRLPTANRLATLYYEWGKVTGVPKAYEAWLDARGRKASDLQQVGERFLNRDQYEEALPYLIAAAKKGRTRAWLRVADIYKRQRRDQDMKRVLDQYVANAKNRKRALRSVLGHYSSSPLEADTIRILEELISLEPNTLSHYEKLSDIYLNQNREREAFELWNTYISRASGQSYYEELERMSNWLNRKGRHQWLLSFYSQVMQKRKDPILYKLSAEALNNYVQRGSTPLSAQRRLKILGQAKDYYERYLKEAELTTSQLGQLARKTMNMNFPRISAKAFEKLFARQKFPQTSYLMNYAKVLLQLERFKEANLTLARYDKRAGSTYESAEKVSTILVQFSRYLDAEPYLKRMSETRNAMSAQVGYERLVEAYNRLDRHEDIAALTRDFLSRASNTTRARGVVKQSAQNVAMWELAAQQAVQLAKNSDPELMFEAGTLYWKAGKIEKAEEIWEGWAKNHLQAERAWTSIGKFYEKHLRPKEALEAYDKAIDVKSRASAPYEARGMLQIRRGKIKQGMADMEKAFANATAVRRNNVLRNHLAVLEFTGQDRLLAQVAQATMRQASADRGLAITYLARVELGSSDPSRQQRFISQIKALKTESKISVNVLMQYGFYEDALLLLDEVIATGDPTVASDLFIRHAEQLTTKVGVDRVMRSAQPLLSQNQRRTRQLTVKLGQLAMQHGKTEQGIALLREALSNGNSNVSPLLGHAYILTGREPQARRVFERYLESVDDLYQRRALLERIRHMYLSQGLEGKWQRWLESMNEREAFVSTSLPLMLEAQIRNKGALAAMSTLRSLLERDGLQNPESRDIIMFGQGLGADELQELFLEGLRRLAALGYMDESKTLISEAQALMPDVKPFERFEYLLTLAQDGEGLKQGVASLQIEEGDDHQERQDKIQQVYRLLYTSQDDVFAQATDHILDQENPKDKETARYLKMRRAFIENDTEGLMTLADRVMQDPQSRVDERRSLIRLFHTMGKDKEGLEMAIKNIQRVPTQHYMLEAVWSAYYAKDKQELERLMAQVEHVSDSPSDMYRNLLERWHRRADLALIRPLFIRYRGLYSNDLSVRLQQASAHFRHGQLKDGRELLGNYLKKADFAPHAFERVMDTFVAEGLWREIGQMHKLSLEKKRVLPPRAQLHAATAYSAMNKLKEAKGLFESYIQGSAYPGYASAKAAQVLVGLGHYKAAQTYAQGAVRRRPDAPEHHLMLALSLLGQKKADLSRGHFKRALGLGTRGVDAYRNTLHIAAQTGQVKEAERIASEWVETVPYDMMSRISSLTYATMTFENTGLEKEALRWLEKNHISSLKESRNLDPFIFRLASLYETVGQPEQLYALYQEYLNFLLLNPSYDRGLPVTLNNFAYSLSTTNQKLEKGEKLARKSLAMSEERVPSTIDTLGWLMYRQGRYSEAEEHVSRAIAGRRFPSRGSDGKMSPAEALELYEHLSTLLQIQGKSESAAWASVYLHRMKMLDQMNRRAQVKYDDK